jgi:hypothetical protein
MTCRKVGSHAALLALLLLAACTTGAQSPPGVDVSGTWAGTWSVPGADSGTIEMRLQQNDGKVTGTLRVTGSAAGDPSGRLEGVVAGSVLRFRLPADPLTADLTVDGDVMTGSGNRNVLWQFALRRQR